MHDEYETMIPSYINNRLSNADREKLETHLALCSDCHTIFLEWQEIAVAVQAVAEEKASSLPVLQIPSNRRRPMLRITATSYRFSLTAILPVLLFLFIVSLLWIRPTLQLSVMSTHQQENSFATVETVLAVRHIAHGEMIAEEDVVLFELPVEYVPVHAIHHLDEVVGMIANIPLVCGQPVQTSQVVEQNDQQFFPDSTMLDSMGTCEEISLEPLTLEIQTVDIPVLVSDVASLTILNSDMFKMKPYPAQLVPEFIGSNLENVIDGTVLFDVPSGTLITPFLMVDMWFKDGSFVKVSRAQVLNDLSPIQFGDKLYLASLLMFIDVDDTYQQIESDQRPLLSFDVIAQDVVFLAQPHSEEVVLGIPDDKTLTVVNYLVEAKIPLLLAHQIGGIEDSLAK